jgi:hypothetical protein
MEPYAMVCDAYPYVANIVMWDGTDAEWRAPAGFTMVRVAGKFCGPGFTYDETIDEFVPAPMGSPGSNYDEAAK